MFSTCDKDKREELCQTAPLCPSLTVSINTPLSLYVIIHAPSGAILSEGQAFPQTPLTGNEGGGRAKGGLWCRNCARRSPLSSPPPLPSLEDPLPPPAPYHPLLSTSVKPEGQRPTAC
ncbi:hypothetical protein BaRGS_00030503 [Batillaria attramentaria]|uniref:Uncharacterized protein n=1 Tax=Batillaria attramentaria TaxID=370345 RepID=A0ABD0JUD1_9CAEN